MHRIFSASAGISVILGAMMIQCAAAEKQPATGEGAQAPARRAGVRAPARPDRGPGSAAYPHGKTIQEQVGADEKGYWLFTPGSPVPGKAPVVLFLHGGRALNPYDYGGWIDHITRRGNIVIYPIFEPPSKWENMRDTNAAKIERALAATRDAIERLKKSGPVKPDLDRFAVTGHSFGGGLTPQIAARAAAAGLPPPRAIMPVQPGWFGKEEMPLAILEQVPESTLVLIIEGDRDQFQDTRQGRDIYRALKKVSSKRFVVIRTDEHGETPLIADHAAPLSPDERIGVQLTDKNERRRDLVAKMTGMRHGEADPLDWLGFWRLFDSLCETAWAGGTIDQVIGGRAEVEMGSWSDGTAVRGLKVEGGP